MGKKNPAAGKTAKAVQTAIPRATQKKGAKYGENVKLVSFTVGATIPTQQYGNIQPKIEVTAPTIEEARHIVMPIIEELYKQYAEKPLSGKEPSFYGKVTETVKEVVPATPTPAAIAEAPAETVAVEPVNTTPKPEPVVKAEKAIKNASTEAAATLIQDQIEKSVKIPQEFKDGLLKLCLQKRKELEGK